MFAQPLREPYLAHSSMKLALDALQQARAKDPSSAAWWSELAQKDVHWCSSGKNKLASWAEKALRVKMSEYLCLTTYLEILDVAAETLSEERCLSGASPIRNRLLDALLMWRKGSFISDAANMPASDAKS